MKKQYIRMLLVSDVINVVQVWVDACELSLTCFHCWNDMWQRLRISVLQ